MRRVTLLLVLCLALPCEARSLTLWRDWSAAAHGGLKDADVWQAGAQLLTIRGPGDSSWIMSHHGFGFDLSYAHQGPGIHQIRPLAVGEFLLFWVFVQAGVGPVFDLENPEDESGVDFMAATGLRIFWDDEYDAPFTISVGVRLDYRAGDRHVTPTFNARLGFPLRKD